MQQTSNPINFTLKTAEYIIYNTYLLLFSFKNYKLNEFSISNLNIKLDCIVLQTTIVKQNQPKRATAEIAELLRVF